MGESGPLFISPREDRSGELGMPAMSLMPRALPWGGGEGGTGPGHGHNGDAGVPILPGVVPRHHHPRRHRPGGALSVAPLRPLPWAPPRAPSSQPLSWCLAPGEPLVPTGTDAPWPHALWWCLPLRVTVTALRTGSSILLVLILLFFLIFLLLFLLFVVLLLLLLLCLVFVHGA